EDFTGSFAAEQRHHDRHQPAHDMRVRIAAKSDDRIGAISDFRVEPNLADAAAHLMRLVPSRLGKSRQGAAEPNEVTVALLPVVQEGEILANAFYAGHHASHIVAMAASVTEKCPNLLSFPGAMLHALPGSAHREPGGETFPRQGCETGGGFPSHVPPGL